MSKRSHKPGKQIVSLIEFILLYNAGYAFYFNHKYMASGFIERWSIFQIKSAIINDRLFTAEKIN